MKTTVHILRHFRHLCCLCRRRRLALLLPAALLLAGCCTTPPIQPIVVLAPGVSVRLPPPPPATAPPVHREQLLAATVNGTTRTLHAVLDIANGKLALAGLSPLGIRLFTGVYDGQTITVEHLPAAAELPPPAQVLGDIMLATCTPAEWAAVLPTGWTLTDTPDRLRRHLKTPTGQIITEITYTSPPQPRAPTRVRNHSFNYEIQITNLDTEDPQ
jgi:hypothetical protein